MSYRSIDLFAGIGGIRMGFDRAFGEKIDTVYVCEWDQPAQATYRANFKDKFEIAGDITQVKEEDVPKFDICLAGFPCQAFSMAGKRGGFKDDYKGRCRGTLFLDVARICDYHHPKVIFCENVKGLTIHDHGETFRIIRETFENLKDESLKGTDDVRQYGYKVFAKILNSKDFGVPQNRERIYLVCFREDIAPETFNFPTGSGEPVSIRDILDPAPIPSKYYLSDVYVETLKRHKARHEAALVFISDDILQVIGYEDECRFVIKTPVEMSEKATYLYDAIRTVNSGKRKLSVPAVEAYLKELKFNSPKTPSLPRKYQTEYGKKTDIVIEIEDSIDGARSREGFSIKSHLGSSPTLFNCSLASNMIYEVEGCNSDLMARINVVDSFAGDGGMVGVIKKLGLNLKLAEDKCNEVFKDNLDLIDSSMLAVIDCAVRLQAGIIPGAKSSDSEDIVEALVKLNPLKKRNAASFYEKKIKDFHFDTFSGMTAAEQWDGRRRITGGYIDVDKDGGLLYYRAVSDDVFCSYLHKHLYFDRPDRGVFKDIAVAEARAYLNGRSLTDAERHNIMYDAGKKRTAKGKWGYVYEEGGKFYMAINFQTRFR